METGSRLEEGYPGAAVPGAALATVFFPLFALIAALLLQGGQPDPRKRSQLRTWAWVSAAWMLAGVLIFVLTFVAIGSGSGVGG